MHGVKDLKAVLDPIVSCHRDQDILLYFRGDATFGNPHVYLYLEVERYWYALRLHSNEILNREIEHLKTRPVGRPPSAQIGLYVEWHRGKLFPHVGFIFTNLCWTAKALSVSTTIGAKVVKHARYIVFQMAEVAMSHELSTAILRRIGKLRLLVEAFG